jgi:hypothetical protein
MALFSDTRPIWAAAWIDIVRQIHIAARIAPPSTMSGI